MRGGGNGILMSLINQIFGDKVPYYLSGVISHLYSLPLDGRHVVL